MNGETHSNGGQTVVCVRACVCQTEGDRVGGIWRGVVGGGESNANYK